MALNSNPSQELPAIWDHTATCNPTPVNVLHLNPSQAGQYSIYLAWRDGRLS